MALSKSLTQIFRRNMLLIGSGWRTAFAPWDYQAQLTNPVAGGPNILDLQYSGPFDFTGTTPTANLPAGWCDTGWIKEFRLTPQTKIGQVRSGYRGAVRAQYRGQVGQQFEFKFREYGRLQYKLSTGVQVYNLLATAAVSPDTSSPLGSPGPAAVSMVSYDPNVPAIVVASASGFSANDYIVCDADFTPGSSGVLGSNGAFAFPNAVSDGDWIRKTSDFVARVASVSGSNILVLDQKFVGGGAPAATNGEPPAGSKVQKILGWTAREGGTFIQEWSGLLIADTIDGAQAAMYYPHVSISQFRGFNPWTLENAGTTDLGGMELDCMFEALAFDDPLDGETIVSYTAFYPSARIQNTY